jgi:predicted ribosomally synthesized peptide with nif11-like leader
MSQTVAYYFIHRLDKDNLLQRKVSQLTSGDMNGLRQIASEVGYHFTADDWRAALQEMGKEDGELSEFMLEQVSGGLLPAQPQNSFSWGWENSSKINPGMNKSIIVQKNG